MVSVDGLPAVCSSLDCGYTYVPTTKLVNDFSLSGLTLTINGDGATLPVQSDIVSIYYSNVLCTITSASTSTIICTLASKVAGSWIP